MTTIDRPSGVPEWQNLVRSRLMAKQAEGEAYRDIIEQCER